MPHDVRLRGFVFFAIAVPGRCRTDMRVSACGARRNGVRLFALDALPIAALVSDVARPHGGPCGGGRTRLTDVHITSPLTNVDVVAAADTERVRPCKVAQIRAEQEAQMQTLALAA